MGGAGTPIPSIDYDTAAPWTAMYHERERLSWLMTFWMLFYELSSGSPSRHSLMILALSGTPGDPKNGCNRT
jgi:hypothetical protein